MALLRVEGLPDDPLAAAAEDDAEIGLPVADRASDTGADGRIVATLGGMRALVVDRVAESGQERHQVLFEFVARVVGADGDALGAGHGSILGR